MKRIFFMFAVLLLAGCAGVRTKEGWQEVLARMPLTTNVTELNRSNCVNLMLESFRPGGTVKALVFMPGATDEFYFFHRARAVLTNGSPTLLDAVAALTNQTRVRADFFPPMLLLHSPEDPLDIELTVADKGTLERLKRSAFQKPLRVEDMDYDHLLPIMEAELGVKFLPPTRSYESFHFYRHSFAAAGLTQWQMLEVMALADKTTVGVGTNELIFNGDARWTKLPSSEPK